MDGINFPSLTSGPMNMLLTTKVGAPSLADGDSRKTEQAAKDFEAVLLGKLMDEMDRTISRSGLLDSAATRQVQGMFWHYLSQEVADQGGLGLWKQLQRQLEANAQDPTPAASIEETEISE